MKQSIRVATGPIAAQLTLPGSKSITNRALLLAALAKGKSTLTGVLRSEDTDVFAAALRQLGVALELNGTTCEISGGDGRFPRRSGEIWCGAAGTAARFLVPACAAVGGSYAFDGNAQLRGRPLAPLLACLRQQGVSISTSAQQLPVTLSSQSKLPGGTVQIEGQQSSQFTSGLLLAAPYFEQPLCVRTTQMVSAPYVAMTCAMMEMFGAQVSRLDVESVSVAVTHPYVACNYRIEPDLSTASYFFAAAAVTGGSCRVQDVKEKHSLQGDSQFLDVLRRMGCTITQTDQHLQLQGPAGLTGVTVNMRDFSDTFMTLAALACFADSPTTITHIGHTRLQESDRMMAMRTNLQKLAIHVEEGEDWLRIYPGQPQAAVLDSFGDHRIAMACAVIGLRVPGITISNADCAAKTCPDFFARWAALTA